MSRSFKPELCCLFGKPVAENPTQPMIEAAFRHHGLNWRYVQFEVEPEALGDAVRGMRALGFRGGNVTTPHKVEIVKHLDRLGESASLMGGEIKDPRRTIPRALIAAGLLVSCGYIMGTVAMLITLPPEKLNSLEGILQAISSGAERLGWRGLAPAIALLICVANLGAVGAYLAALARLPFVVGIDRYLPAAFARVHPKWGTPHISLIVQALCTVVFVVLGQAGSTVHGAYQVLVSMTIITSFVAFLFMFASLISLQREPAAPEVVLVPGGKRVAIAVALVGFTATGLVIIGSLVPDPGEPNKMLAVVKVVALSVVLLSSGGILYWYGRRRRKVTGS